MLKPVFESRRLAPKNSLLMTILLHLGGWILLVRVSLPLSILGWTSRIHMVRGSEQAFRWITEPEREQQHTQLGGKRCAAPTGVPTSLSRASFSSAYRGRLHWSILRFLKAERIWDVNLTKFYQHHSNTVMMTMRTLRPHIAFGILKTRQNKVYSENWLHRNCFSFHFLGF